MSSSAPTIDLVEVQKLLPANPVVYMCAEFAIDADLPVYAGGLGVLAGDLLAQANEENKPFVGITLFYRQGYMRQEISKDANVFKEDPVDIEKAGLQQVTQDGNPLTITITIQARLIKVGVWMKLLGKTPLLLLDTTIEGNEAQDINICDRLYYGDREHRFKQEMILGIGGVRMLAKLAITPRLYHLNEGHSGLMLYELAYNRFHAKEFDSVAQALVHLGNVVFTNHTLVPEGNDVFSKDLVTSYLGSYAMEFPIDPAELIKFGLIQDSSLFSPTMLALRLATVSQAVSKLHAKKALDVWTDHPMVAVTNGVRQSYWQCDEVRSAAGASDWVTLWQAHLTRKKELCAFVSMVTGVTWSEEDLILAWARRLANYKQPLALFADLERLRTLLTNSPKPVRLLLSGKPHAHDPGGQQDLVKILEIVGQFNGSVVYLQNYGIETAKLILSGSDVLLNTPVRGFEACGTSGMKAGMNGVLQCTTLDGWTDEVDWTRMGWVLSDQDVSHSLYETLEKEVIPLYCTRDEKGLPQEWIARMKKTIDMTTTHYSAHRMLEELERLVYSSIRTTPAPTYTGPQGAAQ